MSEIRPAVASDVTAAAPLIFSSGPDAYEYVFSLPERTAFGFLEYAFQDGGGFAGYRNHFVAVAENGVIGTGAFYGLEAHLRLAREALSQSSRHYGMIGALRIVRQSMPVSAMMPPPSEDALYVANLAVSTAVQGQGIGAQMLAHARALAESDHKRALELDVSARNPRAQALYERTGFVVVAERAFRGNRKRVDVPDHRRMRWEIC